MKNSIKDLILEIKNRPAMYLGRNSIMCFKSFIDGWNYRTPETVADTEIMVEFQEWVEDRFNLHNRHSWDRIILFYSQDDSTALDNFFKLFEEFLEGRGAG
jgi:hypothetical protein